MLLSALDQSPHDLTFGHFLKKPRTNEVGGTGLELLPQQSSPQTKFFASELDSSLVSIVDEILMVCQYRRARGFEQVARVFLVEPASEEAKLWWYLAGKSLRQRWDRKFRLVRINSLIFLFCLFDL